MRKRTSRRRWKARYALGKPIPRTAIVEHRLKFVDACRVAYADFVVKK